MVRITLEEIIENMKRYRGKPREEELTSIESLICLSAYMAQSNGYRFDALIHIINSSHT